MKIGKKCQICEGPVVKGRCKFCGMPYRNDEELYHLNENRREHYRHANAADRRRMLENEIPLPDRRKPTPIRPQTIPNVPRSQQRTAKTGKSTAAVTGIIYMIIVLLVVLSSMRGCI